MQVHLTQQLVNYLMYDLDTSDFELHNLFVQSYVLHLPIVQEIQFYSNII